MAVNRTTPTSGPLSGTAYASGVNEEVAALWRISSEPLTSVSGTNTITAATLVTATGGFAAYAVGNKFSFIAAATNTSTVTINIDSLGAKAIKTAGGGDLSAGQIVSGTQYIIEYDGTDFRLVQAVIDLGEAIAGAPEKTALVDADKFAVANSEDSDSLAYIEKADLVAALGAGLQLFNEDEPVTDVTAVIETGLSAFRDVTVTFAVQLNTSGANLRIEARVSAGTWRRIANFTGAGSPSTFYGECTIRNFGRSNNMKIISGSYKQASAQNIDRSDQLREADQDHGVGGYSSYNEQWDEIKLEAQTGNIEGSTSDQRAYIAWYGEGVGD